MKQLKLDIHLIVLVFCVVGMFGLVGCDQHPEVPKANYEEAIPIFKVPVGGYGARAFAAADFDGDGIVDLLSSDNHGNIYFHKGLGDLRFEQ